MEAGRDELGMFTIFDLSGQKLAGARCCICQNRIFAICTLRLQGREAGGCGGLSVERFRRSSNTSPWRIRIGGGKRARDTMQFRVPANCRWSGSSFVVGAERGELHRECDVCGLSPWWQENNDG